MRMVALIGAMWLLGCDTDECPQNHVSCDSGCCTSCNNSSDCSSPCSASNPDGERCVIGICEPGCDCLTTCAVEGAECGTIRDGCGGRLDCDSCIEPDTCGGGGVANVCAEGICVPVTCAEANAECGLVADGCADVLTCGGCTLPEVCHGGGDNQCGELSPCEPDCAGWCGGDDGCDDTCPDNCVTPETCGGGGVDNVCGNTGVSVSTPNGGEIWGMDEDWTVEWSTGVTSITGATVIVGYNLDGAAIFTNFAVDTANDGSQLWHIPNNPDLCSSTARVGVASSMGFSDQSDAVFTIDCHPSLSVYTPVEIATNSISVNGVTMPRCGSVDDAWCSSQPDVTGAGPFMFVWGDGSKTCSSFPAEHTYGSGGNYTIAVRSPNTCGYVAERATSWSD